MQEFKATLTENLMHYKASEGDRPVGYGGAEAARTGSATGFVPHAHKLSSQGSEIERRQKWVQEHQAELDELADLRIENGALKRKLEVVTQSKQKESSLSDSAHNSSSQAAIEEELHQQVKAIKSREEELEQRLQSLIEREKQFKKSQRMHRSQLEQAQINATALAEREAEMDEWLHKLKTYELELEQREDEVIQLSLALDRRERDISNQADELKRTKKENERAALMLEQIHSELKRANDRFPRDEADDKGCKEAGHVLSKEAV
jgi:chromosome segregation ATPase